MENKIVIYTTADQKTDIEVQFEEDTVWLTQEQLVQLFSRDQSVISRHISNIFKEGELDKKSNMQKMHIPNSDKPVAFYNLDVIISVGYRVKSIQGTRFRQWATARLKDYLVQGYAINEKRLAQKQQEVEYLRTGIRIVSRALEQSSSEKDKEVFQIFSKGLELLDDYDHETLDRSGNTQKNAIYPDTEEYLDMINEMYSDFKSDVFAKPKDDSFHSSIGQIRQSFGGKELYPSIEEKAANLLYFVTKNHSFVDGNKRIAAACFMYFLQKNNMLLPESGQLIIDNKTLAALTLFIATSKPDEADAVKQLIISILNRN